jgi:hypothetical protein
MRVMLRVSFAAEHGNQAITDGSLPKIIGSFVEKMKPEACYFFPYEGRRNALFVFNMEEASQLPMVVEPFFEALHAEVFLVPAMNLEDLKKGLANIPH